MKKLISIIILLCFLVTSSAGNYPVYAQVLSLPQPGAMVNLSPAFEPVLIKGLKVHPENPFLFDFIVDTGSDNSTQLKSEAARLVKYFLASLTIPEKDLWVNLSPYEKDRMIAFNLGQTQMGRDMLAQDYILKQLTASLIYPEKHLGKTFWDEVYTKAQQMYGTTQIPVNTFNKVWIVADKADVFERGNVAYVVGAHLKVMLEEDYLSMSKHEGQSGGSSDRQNCRQAGCQANEGLSVKAPQGNNPTTNALASQVVRKVILPELEKEVNSGKNFAPLRQMFYSMILASWYKMALQDAMLTQIYGNQSKVKGGINQDDPKANEEIFQRYLKAYKKGVFNYIREDINQVTQQPMPRKYFSGGLQIFRGDAAQLVHRLLDMPIGVQLPASNHEFIARVNVNLMKAKTNIVRSMQEEDQDSQSLVGLHPMTALSSKDLLEIVSVILRVLSHKTKDAVGNEVHVFPDKKIPGYEVTAVLEDIFERSGLDFWSAEFRGNNGYYLITKEGASLRDMTTKLSELRKALEGPEELPVLKEKIPVILPTVEGSYKLTLMGNDGSTIDIPIVWTEKDGFERYFINKAPLTHPIVFSLNPTFSLMREGQKTGRKVKLRFEIRNGSRRDLMVTVESVRPFISKITIRVSPDQAMTDQSNAAMTITPLHNDGEVLYMDGDRLALDEKGTSLTTAWRGRKGAGVVTDRLNSWKSKSALSLRAQFNISLTAYENLSIVQIQRIWNKLFQDGSIDSVDGTPSHYKKWALARHIGFSQFLSEIKDPLYLVRYMDMVDDWDKPLDRQNCRVLIYVTLVKFLGLELPDTSKRRPGSGVDRAAVAQPGGIDFNRSNMQMNVRKEGAGAQMQFDPAIMEHIKREGFDGLDFQIRSIIPVTDLPLFLGLKASEG